jgi:L-alanine-DL-glutamate epimerase-like enolase superfamily enzyme
VLVYELLGGAVRKKIPVYASHTGRYRMRCPDLFEAVGAFVPRRMEDMATLGAEVGARGGRAQDQPAVLCCGWHAACAHA